MAWNSKQYAHLMGSYGRKQNSLRNFTLNKLFQETLWIIIFLKCLYSSKSVTYILRLLVKERMKKKSKEKKLENDYWWSLNRPVFQYNLPKIFDFILFTLVTSPWLEHHQSMPSYHIHSHSLKMECWNR